jgi:adenylate kinase family enzyme
LPLFIVAGASGAGKTTVCRLISPRYEAVVALDMDILWRAEFDTPADNY